MQCTSRCSWRSPSPLAPATSSGRLCSCNPAQYRITQAKILNKSYRLQVFKTTTVAPRCNMEPSGQAVAAATTSSGSTSGPQPSPSSAIDFLMLLQQLKLTKRTGWVRKNVHGPESIADHMYRMSMMALIATDSSVNVNRCIKMALVHDVAEAIVGDITPHCGVSDMDKHQLELQAVGRIKQMLGEHTAAAREVESLWLEYEAASSPEALLVKDFDKLEMVVTAFQYEQAQPGMVLDEFFKSTAGRFKTETGKAWAEELVARRRRQQEQDGKGQAEQTEAGAAADVTAAAAASGGAEGAGADEAEQQAKRARVEG